MKKKSYNYKCPHCDYLLSKEQFELARFDYGCPRCKTSFKDFVITRRLTMPNARKRIEEILKMYAGRSGYDYSQNPAKKIYADIDQALSAIADVVVELVPKKPSKIEFETRHHLGIEQAAFNRGFLSCRTATLKNIEGMRE
jgi:phage FluMu protein Com